MVDSGEFPDVPSARQPLDARSRWQQAAWAGLQQHRLCQALKPNEGRVFRGARVLAHRLSSVVPFAPRIVSTYKSISLKLPGGEAWSAQSSRESRYAMVACIVGETIGCWEDERAQVEADDNFCTTKAKYIAKKLPFTIFAWPFHMVTTCLATNPVEWGSIWTRGSFWSTLPFHLAANTLMPAGFIANLLLYSLFLRPLEVIAHSAAASRISTSEAIKQISRLPQCDGERLPRGLRLLLTHGVGAEIYYTAQLFLLGLLSSAAEDGFWLHLWHYLKEFMQGKAAAAFIVPVFIAGSPWRISLNGFIAAIGNIVTFVGPAIVSVLLDTIAVSQFGVAPIALQRKAVKASETILEERDESREQVGRLLNEIEPLTMTVDVPVELVGRRISRAGSSARDLGRRFSRTLSGGLSARLQAQSRDGTSDGLTGPERIGATDELTDLSGVGPERVFISGYRGPEMLRVNGEYCRISQSVYKTNSGRPAYTNEHFFLVFETDNSWALKTQLDEDSRSGCFAFCRDGYATPLGLQAPWQVFDLRHGGFVDMPGMAILPNTTAFLRRLDMLIYITEDGRPLASAAPQWEITVRRAALLESSAAAVVAALPGQLLAQEFRVRFQGEEGLDAGGLTREWFDLLGRELGAGQQTAASKRPHIASVTSRAAAAQLASLWTASPDGTLMPRAEAGRDQDGLRHYLVVGRLLAMSLRHDAALGLPLSCILYKCLLERPIAVEDVKQLDPDFFRQRLERLLTPGGSTVIADLLGEPLTFVSAGTDWRPEPEPLVEGGQNKTVTEENKQDYAERLCEDFLIGGIRRELRALVSGFWELLPLDALQAAKLNEWDLQRLVEGLASVDVKGLRGVAQLKPTSPRSQKQFKWFFDVLESLDEEARANVLQFVTGSSRLPAEGPRALHPPFTVAVNEELDEALLPTTHTCVNMIIVPAYRTKKTLQDKLLQALSADAGFGFL